MGNTDFDDKMMGIFLDMVDICSEYSQDKSDYIYIYCAYEQNTILAQFFFKVNDLIIKKNKLEEVLSKLGIPIHNITDSLQEQALNIIIDDIKSLDNLCKEYSKPMPTEIKIAYDVKRKKTISNISYDNKFSDDKGTYSSFNDWFNTVKKETLAL